MELVDIEDDPIEKQLLDALSWAIHFGSNLPRGTVYDEAMKPTVDFYWKAKEIIDERIF
jgi:hypothetical protein